MIIVNSIEEIKFSKDTIITVGTFDGVHRGHQLIIQTLTKQANENNYRSVLITFDPHPREVVGKGPVHLLTTLNERLKIIESLNVNYVVVLKFTHEFSLQSAREFYEKYIIKGIGVTKVVVGYDHTFGHDRATKVDELLKMGNEYNFDVEIIEPVSYEGEIISSSKIRSLLLQGAVDRASLYLNRNYSIAGKVVEGDHRGYSLGFPTANIQVENSNKLIPADGVYCVQVEFENMRANGMLNIGRRPTFKDSKEKIIEVNIFNFDENLYGKNIRIYFIKRIRAENKYSSKEELITQLKNDRKECLKIFTEIPTKLSLKGELKCQ